MSLELRLLDPHADLARVASIWSELEAAARPAYFLTWGWIENWLACLPRGQTPALAVLGRRGEPVAAAFLGRHRLLRHHLVPSRALFLNATGVPRRDELCAEHNAILCAPGREVDLIDLVARLPDGWDELFLPAMDPAVRPALVGLAAQRRYRVQIEREVASPFVDLARVRAAPGGYLSLLGADTRAQIRRARRDAGPLTLEVATDWAQARAIFGELVFLHERSWRERGDAGAFGDPWFLRFHERLIERRFRHGEIELVRLRAGAATIGCLYNLVANGRVCFYQSGLARSADRHAKPGYLCHAAAIERAAAAGLDVYDLLGGDARYKHCLSTGEARLVWACLQQPRARFAIEDHVRRWKRAALDWRAAARDQPAGATATAPAPLRSSAAIIGSPVT